MSGIATLARIHEAALKMSSLLNRPSGLMRSQLAR